MAVSLPYCAIPGVSYATATSTAIAKSGLILFAATLAPRKPTSSCTVPPAYKLIPIDSSLRLLSTSIVSAQPYRLSNALAVKYLPFASCSNSL